MVIDPIITKHCKKKKGQAQRNLPIAYRPKKNGAREAKGSTTHTTTTSNTHTGTD